MRALKICLIGFTKEEQPAFLKLFNEICPEPVVAFHPSDDALSLGNLPACDLILLHDNGDHAWVEHFLRMKVIQHIYQPIVVVVDHFSAECVVRLSNLGADRVIPLLDCWELIAECMPVFFPDVCRSLPQRTREAPEPYLFDGMSGLPRILRTEKLGLVFVERLLDTLDAMVVVLSIEGDILFFNRKSEDMTGYSLADVAGRNFADLFLLPEEKSDVMQVFTDLRDGNFPGQHQNSWLTRDGKEIRLEWSNTALVDENGKVAYVVAVALDITDAYQQARALLAMEQRFSKVFHTTLMGIAICSRPDGRVIQANEGLAVILGVSEADLTGKSLVDISLFPSEAAVQEAFNRVTQQSMPVYLETPITSGDNRIHYVQLSLDVFDLAGKAGLLLLAHDVTERVQAEERYYRLNLELESRVLAAVAEQDAINRELRNEISFRQAIESSSQRLTQIIWETPDIVAITNIEGKLLYLNKHGRKLIGLNEVDSITHLSVYAFYDPEYQKYILREILPYVVNNGSWRGETNLIFRDGRKIPISQVILGHRDENGDVQFFSSIARDISEQKQYEAMLRLSYDREKRLGDMRSSLFSMTSHQFRTPLSTILSSAELLEVYGEQWGQEKRDRHIKRIQDAVQRMEKLLAGILLLSQVESQSNLELVDMDLIAYCRRFIDEFVLNEKELHRFEFDPAVSQLIVKMDEEVLRRILDNLISNALKYSSPGTVVRLEVSLEDGMVVLKVSDHGIGIPEKDMPMLFEPFHRGTNVTEKPGNGLGLMIVQKSLELIEGSIEVFSKIGEGTTVVVRFSQGEYSLGL